MTGTVTDVSGAVIPNTRVTVTSEETGTERRVFTGGTGAYNVPNLNVGSYRVSVEIEGFAKFEKAGLILNANQVINVDVVLKPASLATVAEVTDVATAIDTQTNTLSNVKTSQELERLPLISRQRGDSSFTGYAMLNTGVTSNPNVSVYVQGTRSGGRVVTNDGIAVMGVAVGSGPDQPGVIGVQEVNIQLGNPQAEFSTPANFTLVTKSGTNEFHGMAFWGYNNNVLNARGFFSPSVPFRIYNNTGGAFGGPIRKNKTFFYGNFEDSRESATTLMTADVPLPAWRNGDFSGLPTPIIDPRTGSRFQDNKIPSDRISPVSQKIQDFVYPQPNFGAPGLQSSNFRLLLPGFTGFTNWDRFDTRVDHNFGPNNMIFGRVSYRRMPLSYTDQLPNTGLTDQVYQGRSAVFSYTHIFSPTLLNELRMGGSYIRNFYEPALIGADLLTQFGIQGINPAVRIHDVPIISITGVTAVDMDAASDSHQDVIDTNYEWTDNLSWTHGAHFMKFGIDVIRDYLGGENWSSNAYGAYSFSGVYTGFGYADFLLGIPQTTTVSIPTPRRYFRGTSWALYAQDQFKVSRGLTLNYGIRWQMDGPYYDKYGTMYSFDPKSGALVIPDEGSTRVNPLFPKNIPILTASQAGFPANSLMDFGKRRFLPRVGFAYKPFANRRFVIRGGYGIYDNVIYASLARGMNAGPFAGQVTYNNSIQSGVPLFSFPQPFLTAGTTATQNVQGTNPHLRSPYTQEWNFTVEQQIRDIGFRVSYVGIHSSQIIYRRNLNELPPSTVPFSTSRLFYPIYNQIIYADNGGNQQYNALEVAARKSAGKNLTFNAGWTWSKDITDTQNSTAYGGGQVIQNQFDRSSERANSSYSVPQRFYGYAIYTLPVGRTQRFLSTASPVVEAILGGWSTVWNAVIQAGTYFTPSFSGFDTSNTRTIGGRPDVIPGVPLYPANQSINSWFNAGAFGIPGCPLSTPVCSNPANVGRFGNSGLNVLEAPTLAGMDFALTKSFRLTERMRLQFDANMSNALNHPNFSPPRANISSASTVGTISSATRLMSGVSPSREIDLYLHLIF